MIPIPRELVFPLFALIAMVLFGGMALYTRVVLRRDQARRARLSRGD